MREGLARHHTRGMADPALPENGRTVSAGLLPFYPELFPLRALSLPSARILAGQSAYAVAADAVSAVLPRRLGSRSASESEKNSKNG